MSHGINRKVSNQKYCPSKSQLVYFTVCFHWALEKMSYRAMGVTNPTFRNKMYVNFTAGIRSESLVTLE